MEEENGKKLEEKRRNRKILEQESNGREGKRGGEEGHRRSEGKGK